LPEAGPAFADEDAVAGVAGVVADLDGFVEAEAADAVAEVGDVLGAVVGDAGEAVAVEEDFGFGGDGFFAVEGAGVDDEAVDDAAAGGEALAAAAFDFFGGRAAGADDQNDKDGGEKDARGDAADQAWVMACVFKLGLCCTKDLMEFWVHGSEKG
jgi:hypothetical protein